MNAFKNYVRNKGYKMEEDYPWLPYNNIEAITVNSEMCTYIVYTNVTDPHRLQFNRDGSVTEF